MANSPLPKIIEKPISALESLDYARYMAKRLGEIFVKLDSEDIIENWARKNPGEFLKLASKMLPSFQEVRITGDVNKQMPVMIIDNLNVDNRRLSILDKNEVNAGSTDEGISDNTNENDNIISITASPPAPKITPTPDPLSILKTRTQKNSARQGKLNKLSRERLEKAILAKYNINPYSEEEIIDVDYVKEEPI